MTQTASEQPLSLVVADLLPFLRRYARALTGSQEMGDRYAATTLEALLTDRSIFETASSHKVALFGAFHRIWSSLGSPVENGETGLGAQAQVHLSRLTDNTREALLLNTIEEFTTAEVAEIMEIAEDEVLALLRIADQELAKSVSGEILVIEQHIINLDVNQTEAYKRLLQINREVVHGAFVLNEDATKAKMALSYMLMLPRIPQIYYGTEILMDDTANPGDHGLIRTDFPGGWKGDKMNAFTGEGLSSDKKEMQNFVKTLLNYRKNSEAIQDGKTVHFAPFMGTYFLFRAKDDETVVHIINKNENPINIDLKRYKEVGLKGKTLKNIVTGEDFIWGDVIHLKEKGSVILTTKLN